MLYVRTKHYQNRGSNPGPRGEECLPIALKVVLPIEECLLARKEFALILKVGGKEREKTHLCTSQNRACLFCAQLRSSSSTLWLKNKDRKAKWRSLNFELEQLLLGPYEEWRLQHCCDCAVQILAPTPPFSVQPLMWVPPMMHSSDLGAAVPHRCSVISLWWEVLW